ncbi:hypothetical protein OBBRIDRAFT_749994 [Obba rivulosa]|uniref:Uncharacterized protein n=1 Tax=Obba rivulosa TaxID=1052685 RepID=A0A8E2DP65_9APHY|nr:hypothetical protein OBBRIDRAFT_749994 [Obba rivulosa]
MASPPISGGISLSSVRTALPNLNAATPSTSNSLLSAQAPSSLSAVPSSAHRVTTLQSPSNVQVSQQVDSHLCSPNMSYLAIPYCEGMASSSSLTLSSMSTLAPQSPLSPTTHGPDLGFFKKPILASEVMQMRYERPPVRSTKSDKLIIRPRTRKFTDDPLPAGWNPCTHPEGATYLFYQDREMYMFTRGDNTDPQYLNDLICHGRALYDDLRKNNIPHAPQTELFLTLSSTPGLQHTYIYYFVDHEERCTFWLDDVRAEQLYEGLQGIRRTADIKFAMEAEYWTHCEAFPHNRLISKTTVDELIGIILHASADTLTSDGSTSPFDNEELNKMLKLVEILQAKVDTQDTNSACVLARFMTYFSRGRFYNFYGHPDARLNCDQTIYEEQARRRPFALRVLSWLLFSAPDVHAEEFSKVWVDRLVHKVTWKQFISKLTEEWQDFTLFATVLLNANVAFLAVPGVSNSSSSGSNGDSSSSQSLAQTISSQSPAQIASYMSIIMSIGSILLGLLLVRQNRTKRREEVDGAIAFLTRATNSALGVESLAYIYSLPYALLMWSMVCFVLAVAFLVFQGTTVVTRILSGIASSLVAVLVTWSIMAAWNSSGRHG